MSDTRGTGCGIWPFLLKNSKFYAACEWHDGAYSERSWAERNMNRAAVDASFLEQMGQLSTNWFDKIQAYAFYGAARLLGRFWWEGR